MRTSGHNCNHLLDEDIISRFRESGNAALLGILFDRYSNLVYGLCLKYFRNPTIAEDETMVIFEKLISLLSDQNIDCFRAWLYTFSKNHCLMELRRKKPQIIEFNNQTTSDICHETGNEIIEIEMKKEHQISLLNSLLTYLNPAQKLCLRLFYINNLSYKEVSCSTGMSEKQVKSNIQNGKRNLRLQFKKHEHKNYEHPEE